jgi:hypothetical protein
LANARVRVDGALTTPKSVVAVCNAEEKVIRKRLHEVASRRKG